MKILLVYVCILVLASFSSADVKERIKNAIKAATPEEDVETCMTENGVTREDIYREDQILTDLHKQPENEERTRKNGCFFACLLKKFDLMEDSNIKESKVHQELDKECLIVRSITQECEKCFDLYECIMRAMHKVEGHGEHEIEETEEEKEETTQAE
ncbi:pheromone-binding protein Gp-9-like [Pogonomyrmex barbatus]|uniref:Pheromone-binding protein Gp-9-like n=1 Tax=Pogonomyrmex barbatus TaxID=144034 RepID=A0A6I9VYG2_9HYME|nr:pheromone-binding protein Gp-9-like [Pogonomyrmex barbatus]